MTQVHKKMSPERPPVSLVPTENQGKGCKEQGKVSRIWSQIQQADELAPVPYETEAGRE